MSFVSFEHRPGVAPSLNIDRRADAGTAWRKALGLIGKRSDAASPEPQPNVIAQHSAIATVTLVLCATRAADDSVPKANV